MLMKDERKETIDYIIKKVVEKGQHTDMGIVQRSDLSLLYCSIGILKRDQKGFGPTIAIAENIEIAENFGDPNFQPTTNEEKGFDGIRTLYRGGSDGLSNVLLEGIYFPNIGGEVSWPVERLLRSKDLTKDGEGLTDQDLERFDALLKYAQREL